MGWVHSDMMTALLLFILFLFSSYVSGRKNIPWVESGDVASRFRFLFHVAEGAAQREGKGTAKLYSSG